MEKQLKMIKKFLEEQMIIKNIIGKHNQEKSNKLFVPIPTDKMVIDINKNNNIDISKFITNNREYCHGFIFDKINR